MAGKTEEEFEFDKMFTEHLCTLRKSIGLNKTQISSKAGMTRQTYSQLETEIRTPGLYTIFRVFENLDSCPGDFINELFDAFKYNKRKVQMVADKNAAKEYYKNIRKKKAQSDD